MKKLKDLAKSEYYNVLMVDYQEELNKRMQPDNIPDTNLEDVKAHKKILEFIQERMEKFRKLRDDIDTVENQDSYE